METYAVQERWFIGFVDLGSSACPAGNQGQKFTCHMHLQCRSKQPGHCFFWSKRMAGEYNGLMGATALFYCTSFSYIKDLSYIIH